MSERNAFFANAFARELDKWKKETRRSQQDFAELIDVEPNMITRYKQGKAHPGDERMEAICKVLGVEKAVFYPQTFADWFESSEDFRNGIFRNMEQMEWEALRKADISILFWELLWKQIPYTQHLLPLCGDDQEENLLFIRKSEDGICEIHRRDLEFMKKLQDDVMEYMTMALIKGVLGQRLADARSEAFRNTFDETQIDVQVDRIISTMVLELGRIRNEEETANGID